MADYGVCGYCDGEFALRQDGRLRYHSGCMGSGEPPVDKHDHVHRCELCGARWDENAAADKGGTDG